MIIIDRITNVTVGAVMILDEMQGGLSAKITGMRRTGQCRDARKDRVRLRMKNEQLALASEVRRF